LVVGAIIVSEFPPFFTEVLLHERIDDYFLANGMASNLPGELAGPTPLRIWITLRFNVLGVIFIHLLLRLAN
jgi:hypothetical protein